MRDPAIAHAVALLVSAAMAAAGILIWDNNRYEAERKRWRNRLKK
jgi:hypothetical protein